MALDGTQRKRLSRTRAKCGQACFTLEVCDVKGLAAFLEVQGCLRLEDLDDKKAVRRALEVYINDRLVRFDYRYEEEEPPYDLYERLPDRYL